MEFNLSAIEIEHIVKYFGKSHAVDDVSFVVEPGEIFGLLGPNGAGKTTIIRIMLDLFKPDSGRVNLLGGSMTEGKKNRIGYLPEERGLYQEIRLEQALTYLASLKGLSKTDASHRINAYLERFDLAQHRRKKVKELSKGMQQKAQLIATLVHDPELIIIDEPFSGLDPINTQMVKDILREEKDRGKTIMMSTHQMNQVEELCDRLVLIHQGKVMLYGELNEVRRRFAGQEVLVKSLIELPEKLPGVHSIERHNGAVLLHLEDGTKPQDVLRFLVEANITLEKFEIAIPSLDEIFIQVVQGNDNPE
jgi:ABC-2 type transport system ATP-binding protein